MSEDFASTRSASLTSICSIVMHHRANGQLLTQTQEELALIVAFGLFWLGLLPLVFLPAHPLMTSASCVDSDAGVQRKSCRHGQGVRGEYRRQERQAARDDGRQTAVAM